MILSLREPKITDEKEILDRVHEIENASDTIPCKGISNFKNIENYREWLEKIESNKTIENTYPQYSNQTTYILVDEFDKVYGACNIRHDLKGELINHGGNIGYLIRPSERGKGYASKLMKLEFEKCVELGINKPLLTARVDNIASNKTIQKNGGQMDDQYTDPKTNITYNRYWRDALIYAKGSNKK